MFHYNPFMCFGGNYTLKSMKLLKKEVEHNWT